MVIRALDPLKPEGMKKFSLVFPVISMSFGALWAVKHPVRTKKSRGNSTIVFPTKFWAFIPGEFYGYLEIFLYNAFNWNLIFCVQFVATHFPDSGLLHNFIAKVISSLQKPEQRITTGTLACLMKRWKKCMNNGSPDPEYRQRVMKMMGDIKIGASSERVGQSMQVVFCITRVQYMRGNWSNWKMTNRSFFFVWINRQGILFWPLLTTVQLIFVNRRRVGTSCVCIHFLSKAGAP